MSKVLYVSFLSVLLAYLAIRLWRRISSVRAKARERGEVMAISKAFSFDIFHGLGAVIPLAIFAAAVALFLVILPCVFSAGLNYTDATFYSDYFSEDMGKVCAALGLTNAIIFAIFFWPNFFEVVIFGLIALLVGALYSLVAGFDPSQGVVFVTHTVQSQIAQFINFVRLDLLKV
jgi:hypothetical protein